MTDASGRQPKASRARSTSRPVGEGAPPVGDVTADDARPSSVAPAGDRLADALDRLASMPSRIASCARATEPDLRIGEWSVRDVVLHLAAVEELVWQARLRDLETSDLPMWSWTEPGVASAPGDSTLGGALAILRSRREATLAMVAALPSAARGRCGVHETFGRLDLAGLLAVAADHDDAHLADLASAADAG